MTCGAGGQHPTTAYSRSTGLICGSMSPKSCHQAKSMRRSGTAIIDFLHKLGRTRLGPQCFILGHFQIPFNFNTMYQLSFQAPTQYHSMICCRGRTGRLVISCLAAVPQVVLLRSFPAFVDPPHLMDVSVILILDPDV